MTDAPSVIAHRGFAGTYPENTVAAARAAAAAGADAVEVDVRPTADGTVVCFHDARLDDGGRSRGVTDAAGAVYETPTDRVLDAEILDSGHTVPTLDALLDALPAGVGANVELKPPNDAEQPPHPFPDDADRAQARWDPFVTDVLATLDGFDGWVLLSSFHDGALASTAALAPDRPTAVLVGESLARASQRASRYDAAAVHPPLELFVEPTAAREPIGGSPRDDDARALLESDYRVNAWTVGTWRQAASLTALGVDGLIADYPGLLAHREWS